MLLLAAIKSIAMVDTAHITLLLMGGMVQSYRLTSTVRIALISSVLRVR